MGEHSIREPVSSDEMRTFVRALLQDVQALERMLREGLIEADVRRIGAEQEIFLVDRALRPAKTGQQILARLEHPQLTTELGLFNLEANLTPLKLTADCLSRMEGETNQLLDLVRAAAAKEDTRVLLCGILPTLDKRDLGLDSMTPVPRYYQLNRTMVELRGGEFRTHIKGLDELQTTHDNVMLEACNTSFQIHFQVSAEEFAPLYNLAQAVTGPVLAAAVNSPVMLRHRLWHETRVALLQQSIDTRSETETRRGHRQRVSFGERWVEQSVLEIFREDIARFRALISVDRDEPPSALLDRGEIPRLKALCLHNSTVYRWNRPCYGVTEGRPHLRIENRVLPAGPTPLDQVANAAFFFGLMCAVGEEYGDVSQAMVFDDARHNFLAAARYGLQARLRWIGGEALGADQLILERLLPLAREGLREHSIDASDIDRYLGVIEERVASSQTGAQWVFDSLAGMDERVGEDRHYRALVAAMLSRQASGSPVHRWEPADEEELDAEQESYRTVGQFMTTQLFTVGAEDLVDLAANLMDWEHIRHVPVEDNAGRLLGIVSHRSILRCMAGRLDGQNRPVAIREIMQKDPVTVTPDTGTMDAIALMRANRVSCLPVIENDKLVGIVTERDFIGVSARLLDRWLQEGA